MNKHAQNLRAMLVLLPLEVCQTYRDTITKAADELDRLDKDNADLRVKLGQTPPLPPAPPPPRALNGAPT